MSQLWFNIFVRLWQTLQGNLGYTLQTQQVLQYIKVPLKNTIRLNLAVMFFVFSITFPLGIKTAVKKIF